MQRKEDWEEGQFLKLNLRHSYRTHLAECEGWPILLEEPEPIENSEVHFSLVKDC